MTVNPPEHTPEYPPEPEPLAPAELAAFLAGATIDPAVLELRPDYRVVLIAADGIRSGPSDDLTEKLLVDAEQHAQGLLAAGPVEDQPHIAAWREAYRAFGAKPQRTRNSLEALTRRAESVPTGGLPRVNRLTDLYNAISVKHQLPIGGEDLRRYEGSPRLWRAVGDEPFDTVANGAPVIEHPLPGEVVWGDGAGVTCRLWNWRQARRTQLREDTTAALFILDALAPMTDEMLDAAADVLIAELRLLGDEVTVARRRMPS